jgi:phosphosulfolactate synthase (CoM biosynthesis protein A)
MIKFEDSCNKIINIWHERTAYVTTDDFEFIDKYLEECENVGFDIVEISSGLGTSSIRR